MSPNVKPTFMTMDNELITVDDVDQSKLTEMLDKQADTNGLKNMNGDTEDWTDVKHSERKKRDRILDGKLDRLHINFVITFSFWMFDAYPPDRLSSLQMEC
jgi:hypothetical protein